MVLGEVAPASAPRSSKNAGKDALAAMPIDSSSLDGAAEKIAALAGLKTDADRKQALLEIYKQSNPCIEELKKGDPRSVSVRLSCSIEAFFDDLYSKPKLITPPRCGLLEKATARLADTADSHAHGRSEAPESCRLLLVIEDDQMRGECSAWFDKPGLDLFKSRDIDVGCSVLLDNRFDLAVFAVRKQSAAEKIKKAYRDGDDTNGTAILFLLEKEKLNRVSNAAREDRTEFSEYPPLRSELLLRSDLAAGTEGGI